MRVLVAGSGAVRAYSVRMGGYRRLMWLGGKGSESGLWDAHWSRVPLGQLLHDARRDAFFLGVFEKYLPKGTLPVLEGGCGLGQWVQVLGEKGWRAVGLDFARQSVRLSRERLTAAELMVGDVRHAPLRDGSLGGYVSLGVAEHFPDGPGEILGECHRLLVPRGRLIISVPYVNPIRRLKMGARRYPSHPAGDAAEHPAADAFYQYAFSAAEFRQLLEADGFTVLAEIPYGAMNGVCADVPFAGRVIRSLRGTSVGWTQQATQEDKRGLGEKSPNGGRSEPRGDASIDSGPGAGDDGSTSSGPWAWVRKGARRGARMGARWLCHRALTRRLAGHMMLYVAEKK